MGFWIIFTSILYVCAHAPTREYAGTIYTRGQILEIARERESRNTYTRVLAYTQIYTYIMYLCVCECVLGWLTRDEESLSKGKWRGSRRFIREIRLPRGILDIMYLLVCVIRMFVCVCVSAGVYQVARKRRVAEFVMRCVTIFPCTQSLYI